MIIGNTYLVDGKLLELIRIKNDVYTFYKKTGLNEVRYDLKKNEFKIFNVKNTN